MVSHKNSFARKGKRQLGNGVLVGKLRKCFYKSFRSCSENVGNNLNALSGKVGIFRQETFIVKCKVIMNIVFSHFFRSKQLFNSRSVPDLRRKGSDQAVNQFRLKIQYNIKASLFSTYTGITRNLRLNEVFPDHISRLAAFPDFGTWYFPMQPDPRTFPSS